MPRAIVLAADSITMHCERAGIKKHKVTKVEDTATKIHQIGRDVAVTNCGKHSPFLLKGGEKVTIDSLLEDFSREFCTEDDLNMFKTKWYKFLAEKVDIEAEEDKLEKELKEAIEKDGGQIVELQKIEPSEIRVEYLKSDGTKGICTKKINDITLMLAGHRRRRFIHTKTPYVETFPNLASRWYLFSLPFAYDLYLSGCNHVVNAAISHFQGYMGYPFLDLHSKPHKPNALEFLELHRKLLGKLDSLGRKIRLTLDEATELVVDMITATALYENIPDAKLNKDSKYDVPRVMGPPDIAVIQTKRGFQWHTIKGVRQE